MILKRCQCNLLEINECFFYISYLLCMCDLSFPHELKQLNGIHFWLFSIFLRSTSWFLHYCRIVKRFYANGIKVKLLNVQNSVRWLRIEKCAIKHGVLCKSYNVSRNSVIIAMPLLLHELRRYGMMLMMMIYWCNWASICSVTGNKAVESQ